ncbi:MAG: dUTP diphosphatase [bacterium]
MELKFKKLSKKATTPKYANETDACFDLVATTKEIYDGFIEYGTGIAMEIPKGYVGLLFSRSSVTKKSLILKNSVGIIDSGYRGEIKFRFYNTSNYNNNVYEIGDRVGQMMIIPIPTIDLAEVDELEDSDRGEGSFGSTGK